MSVKGENVKCQPKEVNLNTILYELFYFPFILFLALHVLSPVSWENLFVLVFYVFKSYDFSVQFFLLKNLL